MTDEIKTTAEAYEGAVLARVAHCDPNCPPTAEQSPLPAAMSAKKPEQKSPAEWAYERIILYIQKFEEGLDSDHEVAMGFAGGDVGTIHIQGVGFFAPDLITFYGADQSGARTQLVQHVSQLSVMFKAATKIADEPNRIGFHLAKGLESA